MQKQNTKDYLKQNFVLYLINILSDLNQFFYIISL